MFKNNGLILINVKKFIYHVLYIIQKNINSIYLTEEVVIDCMIS